MEKILFIIIVAWLWSKFFSLIYGCIVKVVKLSTIKRKESTKEDKATDKRIAKALKEYEKVCDRYNEKSAIYQAMADNLPHDDNEKSELKMAVEFAKLESKYQKMVNVRQAIIDTYGVDPGDEDGYKVSL